MDRPKRDKTIRVGERVTVRATWLVHDGNDAAFGQTMHQGHIQVQVLSIIPRDGEVYVRCDECHEFHDEDKNYRLLKVEALLSAMVG